MQDMLCIFIYIDVGCSASSSSASQPFLFNDDHPLVTTYEDRPGSFDWDMLFIDRLQDLLPLYNLEELFTYVNFTSESREQFPQKVEADRHSIAWVSSLIEHHQVLSKNRKNLIFTSGVEIKSLAEALMPFRCSLENRPDGVVMRTFDCDGKEWKLPLFILEVDSGNYKNTVSQLNGHGFDRPVPTASVLQSQHNPMCWIYVSKVS